MNILITGGHPAPALAFVDEALGHEGVSVEFVGRAYGQEHDETHSFEYQEVQKRPNTRFFNLQAGRFTRTLSSKSIGQLLGIPLGFMRALRLVSRLRPDCVVSFGGYIALPVAVAAWILRIPVYTHEQTIAPGLANRIIATLSRRVFVAFDQAAVEFEHAKTMVVGNPLRKQILTGTPMRWKHENPTIFVTGGSLGSHSINIHIERILGELLNSYNIIHQTGSAKEYGDFERLERQASERYRVYRHIPTTEIGDIYATADLVVARAGANTVSELAALKKPSVLIPLPWAARQEQEKHARYMEQHGLATVFEQHESSTHLLHCIRDILARHIPKHAFDSVAYLGSVTCAAVMFETIFKDISKQARQSL